MVFTLVLRLTAINMSVIYSTLFLSITLFTFNVAQASNIALSHGWTHSPENDIGVYKKEFFNTEMIIRVMPWQRMDSDLARWLKAQWKQPYGPVQFQTKTGSQPVAVAGTDASGSHQLATVGRNVMIGDQTLSSILIGCAREGYVQLTHIYGRAKAFTSHKAQNETQMIIQESCEKGPQKEGLRKTAKDVKPILKRPNFQPGATPSNFAGLWYIAEFVPDVYGARADETPVMLFKNGDVTEDINKVFASGIDISKRNNPKNWGRWRKNGNGQLEIKWNGRNDYKDYYLTRKTQAGAKDLRLNECFSSRSGYSLGFGTTSTHSMSVKKWCFGKNGRFSNKGVVSVSGGGSGGVASAGYAGSDKEGYYRIDGHVIQLIYDNGQRVITSFGLLDANRTDRETRLLLGEGNYRD